MKSGLTGKDSDAGKDQGQEENGATEDKMVGWHHRLNEYEFEETLGDMADREGWCTTVHRVAKSQTQLSE